jgi:hypothetical protein
MAAGLGFKTFNTGEVLTSADVNGYLMQGVLVFASEAARDAAITSPQEGQFAYTKDNNSLWYYTGSAWAASGATGDIEGVTAGTGISGGGTSGTVTITNSMATAIDAKGDLVVGTGADTFARLAVGTNGHTLVADSVEATGLKWAAPSVTTLPAFGVKKNAAQSLTAAVTTKLTWQTELFDPDSKFASDRFTPGVAGYYQINAGLEGSDPATTYDGTIFIYKTGVAYASAAMIDMSFTQPKLAVLLYLDASDYVEVYANLSTNSDVGSGNSTYFNGAGIRS